MQIVHVLAMAQENVSGPREISGPAVVWCIWRKVRNGIGW